MLATRDLPFPEKGVFFASMSQRLYNKYLDTLDDIIDRETGRKIRRCECPCQCYVRERMLDEDNICYKCVCGKHPGRHLTEGKRYVKARTIRRFGAGKR